MGEQMKSNHVPTSQVEKLLLPEEVAHLMTVSRITVLRLAKAGRIPAIRVGKVYRFSRAAIEAWLSSQLATA
jgi:excisionase family DNA binding protein